MLGGRYEVDYFKGQGEVAPRSVGLVQLPLWIRWYMMWQDLGRNNNFQREQDFAGLPKERQAVLLFDRKMQEQLFYVKNRTN